MIKSEFKLTGRLMVTLYNPTGGVKEFIVTPNIVTSAGKQFIAEAMVGSPSQMTHMALGGGTTTAQTSDTTLGGELGRSMLTNASHTGAVTSFAATFAAGVATGPVTEAGIFNAASGGIMLARTVFGVMTKEAGDSIGVAWEITAS